MNGNILSDKGTRLFMVLGGFFVVAMSRMRTIAPLLMVAMLGIRGNAQTTPQERSMMREHRVMQITKKQYHLFRDEDDLVSSILVESYDTLGNLFSLVTSTSSTGYGMQETLNATTLFTYDTMGNVLSRSRTSAWELEVDSFRYEYNQNDQVVLMTKTLYRNGERMYALIEEFIHDSTGRVVLDALRNENGSLRHMHQREYDPAGCPVRTKWCPDERCKRPLSTTAYECDTMGRVVVERTRMNDRRQYETQYIYDTDGRCVQRISGGTITEFWYNDIGLPSGFRKVSEQRHLSFRETVEYAYW